MDVNYACGQHFCSFYFINTYYYLQKGDENISQNITV